MTIAITGASGQFGRLVLRSLKKRGAAAGHLVALVRSPDKAAGLGVALRQADYDRPETLEPALKGVDVLLLISASELGKRAAQHRNVIAAARAAGVGHIVYTSLLHADRSAIGLAAEHRETEADLAASGLPFTLLRNGWYTENYAAGIAPALANGAVYGAAGEGRIASATRADYAKAAAAVLLDQRLRGRTWELSGDSAYTLTELAAEVSRQSGRDIPYVHLSEDAYAKALQDAGFPAPVAQVFAGFDAAAAQGALDDDGHDLSRLIGRPTTPLSEVVGQTLAAAQAA